MASRASVIRRQGFVGEVFGRQVDLPVIIDLIGDLRVERRELVPEKVLLGIASNFVEKRFALIDPVLSSLRDAQLLGISRLNSRVSMILV